MAYYDFTANAAASSDTDANSTAANFSIASGGNINTLWLINCPIPGYQCSVASFSVTPATGYELNLQGLTFLGQNPRGPGSLAYGDVAMIVQTSLDGYTAIAGSANWTFGFGYNWTTLTIDLSGPAFQHLTTASLPGGSLGVRLTVVAYNSVTASLDEPGFGQQIDNIALNGVATADTDLDGLADTADNCTLVANSIQLDSDADGYGNICDPDFNNDGTVNINDFNRLKARLGIAPVVDVDTDLDGNGAVNINDLNRLKSFLGKPPGPSGLHPNCPPTCP